MTSVFGRFAGASNDVFATSVSWDRHAWRQRPRGARPCTARDAAARALTDRRVWRIIAARRAPGGTTDHDRAEADPADLPAHRRTDAAGVSRGAGGGDVRRHLRRQL